MTKYILITEDKIEKVADSLRHARTMHKEFGGKIKQIRINQKGQELVKYLSR